MRNQKLTLTRGDDTTLPFALPASSDVLLTDATDVTFTTRCQVTDTSTVWMLTLASGITVLDALSLTVDITAAMWDDWESAGKPDPMVFDIQTTIDALIVTRAKGVITVELDVTHA